MIELKSDRFISKSFQIIGLGINSNKSPTYNSSINVPPYISEFFNIDSIGIIAPPSGEKTYRDVPMTRIKAWPFHFGNFHGVLVTYCAVKLEFSPTAFDLLSQD